MNILIIGAGQLGLPLACELQRLGHNITSLSRSAKHVPDGVTHLCCDVHTLNKESFDGQRFDWVYVILTPSERSIAGYAHAYVHSITPISTALADCQVSRLIYVSSTQVFSEDTGAVISDDTLPLPTTDYGHVLYAAELLWRAYWQEKLIILRPSGLIGEDATFLKKSAAEFVHAGTWHWLNLIHRDDVIKIMASLPSYAQKQSLKTSYILSHICLPRHTLLNALRNNMGLAEIVVCDALPQTGKQLKALHLDALLAANNITLKDLAYNTKQQPIS